MEGYQVAVLDDVISDADIVITATTHIQVVRGEHIAKMKDHAIIGNIGQYDPECDVDWIVKHAVSHTCIKPQVDKYTFASGKSVILLAEGRLVNLCCAEGHLSFIMSVTFSNTLLAAIELYRSSPKQYEAGIHLLPKKIIALNGFGKYLTFSIEFITNLKNKK
ncbi:Adenosylhomocysteinase [Thelohanellus kitauei]|uniref:Adenosylhomocysteinase n=1 Tax=Thelohanellus kitauei TaxID=669202 RepID=A0A0C2N159_THEKT|nr:Adenosylhomocysteinase [Thelohanellus kitauei]